MTAGRTAEWISFVMLLRLCFFSQGLTSDGDILLEFKSNVFDRLNSLGTWGSPGEDPCGTNGRSTWAGVSCRNLSDSRWEVSALELRSFSLASSDISVLADLKNLYKLDLRDNSFSGDPPDLNRLEGLVHLFLGNNQFKGHLEVRFPPKLLEIEVQNNFFTGEIGITNLFQLSLQRLDLHGNKFSGKLPDMSFSGLEYFDVSGNQFEGPLPSASTKVDLLYCNMSGNRFIGTIEVDPKRGWFPSGVLDLSRNRLSGTLPARLFTSSGMTYLDLGDNDLEGPIPSEVSEDFRKQIQYLYLQNNRLSGDVYKLLRINFSSLVELRLHGNAIRSVGGGFTISTANETLKTLEVLCNNITLRMSTRCYNCAYLLYGRFFGGAFNYSETMPLSLVNQTANLPRLRVLDLSSCSLQGSIPSDIFNPKSLPSLKILDLSRNQLSGTIPAGLTQMPRLQELRLRGNSLLGNLDNWVDSNWRKLEVLDISQNCLCFDTSQTLDDMLNFSSLRELRLGRNIHLSMNLQYLEFQYLGLSYLPFWHEVFDLESMIVLYTSRTLPTLHGLNLQSLEVLDLSHLALSGNISDLYSSPKALPSLRYLDLSDSFLDGPVAEEFRSMPTLTHLNLSYNSLSGRIPRLPLLLFKPEFFTGNEFLCGPPLQDCSVHRKSLATWLILVIVSVCVLLTGSSCLFLGWIWRKRIDAKKHEQDVELIATLLDRDSTTLMPLRELKKATDDFSEENQIGAGGFGTVYRGLLGDGTVVAIKKSKRDGSTSEDKRQFLNEVKILSQIHHRNLVRLLGCCLANKTALLVFEFVPNGTLQEHLRQEQGHSPLTWNQRLIIAIQTASALDYLHSSANPPVYHLDVKSANILLDQNLNAKVADFGISKLATTDATHITTLLGLQGTFGYMDPELVVKSMLTGKSDVYAFGVVLLELITAKAVVDRSRGEDVSLIKWAGRLLREGRLDEITDPVILDTSRTRDGNMAIDAVAGVAQRCLLFRSEHRPSMKDVTRDLLNIQQRSVALTSGWVHMGRNNEMLPMSSYPKQYTI